MTGRSHRHPQQDTPSWRSQSVSLTLRELTGTQGCRTQRPYPYLSIFTGSCRRQMSITATDRISACVSRALQSEKEGACTLPARKRTILREAFCPMTISRSSMLEKSFG